MGGRGVYYEQAIKKILSENSKAQMAARLAAQLVVPRMRKLWPETAVEVVQRCLVPHSVMASLLQGSAVAAVPDGTADPLRDAAVGTAGVVEVVEVVEHVQHVGHN